MYQEKSNVCDFCSWDEGLFTEHDGELYCDECFEKLTNLGEGNGQTKKTDQKKRQSI